MADTPEADLSSEQIHHEALRQELEAARRRRDGYQALLKDLPDIFEGRFRERLRPLQQRNEELLLEAVALREQIRRALPQQSAAAAPAPLADPQPPRGGEAETRLAEAPAAPPLQPDRIPETGPWVQAGNDGSGADETNRSARAAATFAGAHEAPPALIFRTEEPGAEMARSGEPSTPLAPDDWPSAARERTARRQRDPHPSREQEPNALATVITPLLWRWSRQGLPLAIGSALALGVVLALPHVSSWLRRPAPLARQAREAATTAAVARISSNQPNWLEVESGDGTNLYYGLLEGERSFPLGRGLRLRAGRPDLIRIRIPGRAERILGRVEMSDWQTLSAPTTLRR